LSYRAGRQAWGVPKNLAKGLKEALGRWVTYIDENSFDFGNYPKVMMRFCPMLDGPLVSVWVGTTTHRIESSSTDRTHSRESNCVLCYQWVASITTANFIGTHTPDFERVRTDDLTILAHYLSLHPLNLQL
jgi:hypothetical protein